MPPDVNIERPRGSKSREEKLARALKNASERDMRRLLDAAGSPPNFSKIPRSLIDEVVDNIKKASAVVLREVFLLGSNASRRKLGADVSPSDIAARANDYADQHAEEIAEGMTETTLEQLKRMIQEGKDRDEILKRTAGNTGRFRRAANFEVGNAAGAGAEGLRDQFEEENEGWTIMRIWRHPARKVPGKHPCPKICAPLIGEPAWRWPIIHPGNAFVVNGPPAHPNCDCETTDRILTIDEAKELGL